MTPEELASIEALANSATPGPWRVDHSGDVVYDEPYVGVVGVAENLSEDDAAFIAAARQAVPTLVAEVKRFEFDLEEASAFAMGNVHAVNALHEQIKELKAELVIARASREPKP